MSSFNQSKFRPYFSPAELTEIIRCVKAASTNQSLLAYLEAFAIKIKHGVMQPQLTTNPLSSLESRLGLTGSSISALPGPVPPTPAELYTIWKSNPEYLSPPQLSIVHTYRWENGLMTEEESNRFETALFDGASPT